MTHPDLPRLALSIRQPWAWAILNLGKDVENRTWDTRFRGRFCIHAAKGMKDSEFDGFVDFLDQIKPLDSALQMIRRRTRILGELTPRGGIVATAELASSAPLKATTSPWAFGPYCFALADIQPVPFIPVRGALGFFDWRRQLEGEA